LVSCLKNFVFFEVGNANEQPNTKELTPTCSSLCILIFHSTQSWFASDQW